MLLAGDDPEKIDKIDQFSVKRVLKLLESKVKEFEARKAAASKQKAKK